MVFQIGFLCIKAVKCLRQRVRLVQLECHPLAGAAGAEALSHPSFLPLSFARMGPYIFAVVISFPCMPRSMVLTLAEGRLD